MSANGAGAIAHPARATCIDNIEAYTIAPDIAERSAAVLKAAADPLRLRMLALIDSAPGGEACVCDLTELSQVTGPTVSHHLKTLKEAGLVTSERRGTWVFYRIADRFQPAIRAVLGAFVPATAGPTRRHAPTPSTLTDGDYIDPVLDAVATDLANRFPGIGKGEVTRVVRDSFTALARGATAPDRLAHLTRNFAAQRLEDIERAQAPAGTAHRAPQILFVCVQNAGRSQLAASMMRRYAGAAVVVRTAGSAPAPAVHAAVAPLLTAPDAGEEWFPKPLTDDAVRAADVIVTMGCGDLCPVYPGKRYEDWQVGDPAVASPAGIEAIVASIDHRVRVLIGELLPGVSLPPT